MVQILLIPLIGYLTHKTALKSSLPKSVLYILIGILLGPQLLNVWSQGFLNLAPIIRQLALVVILLRTGFSLKLDDLKTIGLPALLMSFVPAIFEVISITLIAPLLFDISRLDAALLGSVLAAVSPAVVIPQMITIIDEDLGQERKVPQLILAGASLDDIFAIVLFESLLAMSLSAQAPLQTIQQLPLKLSLGILIGIIVGFLSKKIYEQVHLPHLMESVLILIIAGIIMLLESEFSYSGLLAIMVMGFILMHNNQKRPKMNQTYNSFWNLMELLLFIIVGASVTFSGLSSVALKGVILLFIALVFRSCGVFTCLLWSPLNIKERLFTMLSYIPKATVQAALGSIPLSMGLASGNLILSMSVIAILITAPLGAILIQKTKFYLLD